MGKWGGLHAWLGFTVTMNKNTEDWAGSNSTLPCHSISFIPLILLSCVWMALVPHRKQTSCERNLWSGLRTDFHPRPGEGFVQIKDLSDWNWRKGFSQHRLPFRINIEPNMFRHSCQWVIANVGAHFPVEAWVLHSFGQKACSTFHIKVWTTHAILLLNI